MMSSSRLFCLGVWGLGQHLEERYDSSPRGVLSSLYGPIPWRCLRATSPTEVLHGSAMALAEVVNSGKEEEKAMTRLEERVAADLPVAAVAKRGKPQSQRVP